MKVFPFLKNHRGFRKNFFEESFGKLLKSISQGHFSASRSPFPLMIQQVKTEVDGQQWKTVFHNRCYMMHLRNVEAITLTG